MTTLSKILAKHSIEYHVVVPFNAATDKLLHLNFTNTNTVLTAFILNDTILFSQYINNLLDSTENTGAVNDHLSSPFRAGASWAKYGVGGYNEHRTVYARSSVFDDADEPRRLHLGVDIWGPAGTPVFCPLDGTIHSFAFNNNYGDYGATIILKHALEGSDFFTLYGHLSLQDLVGLEEGKVVNKGEEFAHFGEPAENGEWPPHLHFQLIENMGDWKGDYPGVCKFSERDSYLINSPDPDLILRMMQYAVE